MSDPVSCGRKTGPPWKIKFSCRHPNGALPRELCHAALNILLSGPRSQQSRSRLRVALAGPPSVCVRHAGPAIAGAGRMIWRGAATRPCAIEHRGPEQRAHHQQVDLSRHLQHRRPALMYARAARSKSPAPRLASARHSLANRCALHFLSRRCVRSKIGTSASPQPPLLHGPAVVMCFRRRARNRWPTPRQPVRRSRPDTMRLLACVDRLLLARAAGPSARCPSPLIVIPAALDI